jgi:hypothetical protein
MCTPNYALKRRPEVRRGRPRFHPGRHRLRPEAGSARVLPAPDRARDVDLWKSKFHGAFVLNIRVDLHAIDATPTLLDFPHRRPRAREGRLPRSAQEIKLR